MFAENMNMRTWACSQQGNEKMCREGGKTEEETWQDDRIILKWILLRKLLGWILLFHYMSRISGTM
jgi:hypothetical protein